MASSLRAAGSAGAPGRRDWKVDMVEIRTKEVDDLLEVLAGLTDPDEVFALLEDLFTVREIKDTSQRLDVARMLRDGSSYAVIEKATGASATTIARVSKALNYGAGGYQCAFKVLDARDAAEGQQASAEAPVQVGSAAKAER